MPIGPRTMNTQFSALPRVSECRKLLFYIIILECYILYYNSI